jgi:serine/threonine protein kinase
LTEPSVEALCNNLARSRLLPPDEVRKLHRAWVEHARGRAAETLEFARWLVSRGCLTEYQAGALLRGHGGALFLGPYKILERIGKGRMAGVYRAVHQVGPVVAVKVLPPSKAKDPQLLNRFLREARLATALKHQNLVRTFEYGQEGDLHYLVMEHLEGETLEEVLQRRGRLPPFEAVRLVYQALAGLQYLHDQGVVHRDLKPGNLMLVPGRTGDVAESTLHAVVKVLDIGTGRALFDEDVPGNFNLTNEGDLLGTPDYLAPEQARDPHTADIRADIYSLGCTLYHCLAGVPPFADSNRVRQLMRHATEAPRSLHEINPDVPEGLEQIVNWMLAKDPAQRYPTPGRAAKALKVFLASGADLAAPAEPSPQMLAYLSWLEKAGPAGVSSGGTADSLPAERPASAPPAPSRRSAAPPRGGTGPAPPAAPAAPRRASPRPAVAEVDVDLAEPPVAPGRAPAPAAVPVATAVPVGAEAEPPEPARGRECLLIGLAVALGLGLVACVALIVFLLYRLLGS